MSGFKPWTREELDFDERLALALGWTKDKEDAMPVLGYQWSRPGAKREQHQTCPGYIRHVDLCIEAAYEVGLVGGLSFEKGKSYAWVNRGETLEELEALRAAGLPYQWDAGPCDTPAGALAQALLNYAEYTRTLDT